MGYRSDRLPEEIHGLAASLDTPDEFTPQVHYFTGKALPWCHISDSLHRYTDGGKTPDGSNAKRD